jgi:hypothetical protein
MEEICFYHCFPRRPGQTPLETRDQGLATLRLMLELGLLLVPERQSIKGIELTQGRMCFTALHPRELWNHSLQFGSFAIEFSAEGFLSLGGLPAIYLPERDTGEYDLSDAGARFIHGLGYVREVLLALKDSKSPDVLNPVQAVLKNRTDLANLAWVPVIAQNLFYPVDSAKHVKVGKLGYYSQREWKIIDNFPRVDAQGKVVWDFTQPTPDQQKKLIVANKWFEGEFKPGVRRIELCRLFTAMGDVKVIDKVRRIIVPSEHALLARELVGDRIPVATLEEVAGIAHSDGSGI